MHIFIRCFWVCRSHLVAETIARDIVVIGLVVAVRNTECGVDVCLVNRMDLCKGIIQLAFSVIVILTCV